MEKLAEIIAPDTVRLERVLNAPVETVWAYLTEPEKRVRWMAAGDVDLRVGGTIVHIFDHNKFSPEPGVVPERFKSAIGYRTECVITALEPPVLIAYDWDDDRSNVEFALTPEGEATRLVITHRNLKDRKAMVDVSGGWHSHSAVLKDLVEGRTPPNFWKLHEGVDELYERAYPA